MAVQSQHTVANSQPRCSEHVPAHVCLLLDSLTTGWQPESHMFVNVL